MNPISKRRVTVLGSTGSVGVSTLDVIARHPEHFEVFALSAATRVDELHASLDHGGEWPDGWLDVAVLELARGSSAAALDAVQRAVDAGYRDRAYLQTSALFRALAAEPRFAATLDAIGRAVARERDAVLAEGLPAGIADAK